MNEPKLVELKYVSSCYANEESVWCTYSFKKLNEKFDELLVSNPTWDKTLFTFDIVDGYFEIYYPLEESDEEYNKRVNQEKIIKDQRRADYLRLRKEFKDENI